MSEKGADRAMQPAAGEAVDWFVRLQRDDASAAEWQAFEAWLGASPEHAAAYEAVEALWVDLDEAGGIVQARVAGARRTPPRRASQPAPRRWLAAGAAIAASLVVGVFVAGRLAPEPSQTWRTAAGETRVIDLADGSHIRLNAASLLKVTLRRHTRDVELAEGEAAFDVAHDPKRPFLIAVGDRQVRVVGTEFDLRRRDGAIALTVRRGVVEVRAPGEPDADVARLTVGQQLTHREGETDSTIRQVEPGVAFAWTQGQLIYQDAPMSQVAADLSRRFGVTVRVADAETGRLKFTGVLVTDSVSAVLRRIEAYAPVASVRSGDGFVLQRRAAKR